MNATYLMVGAIGFCLGMIVALVSFAVLATGLV